MARYIKTFEEMVTSQDMMNNLNLGIEKTDAQNPAQNQQQQQDVGIQKNANLKITDIQARINQIEQQKKLVNQEIINLQGAQRDLMPNNPGDPKNAEKQKIFTKDQQEKIEIQQRQLKVLNDQIENLKSEIERHKQNYL